MKQLQDLLNTGVYEEYTPNKAIFVKDLLEDLNLTNDQIFTVLVNGKRAELNTIVNEKDKISIIPQIAGGQETPVNHLKWLLESFDKKYIKELFEEGEKVDLFNGKEKENFQYPFEGWTYTLSRYKMTDPYSKLMKELGL